KDASFDIRRYADYVRNSGTFEEVVLFVCCTKYQVGRVHKFPYAPPPEELKRPCNYFYAFAHPADNDVSGITAPRRSRGEFTSMLLDGFDGGAASGDGIITSRSLTHYVRRRMSESSVFVGNLPTFELDGDIVFQQGAVQESQEKGRDIPESV